MTEFNLDEVLEHPERITEEVFRSCSRSDQLMILIDYRRDFRELFLEINGSFSYPEEVELILNHLLECEDAAHKSEFTGYNIQRFIIEGALSLDEFKKMNYAERLTAHNWCGILSETDPDDVWKDFCDFSRFDNDDWVNLLTWWPEYADRCPFEKLGPADIEVLLREQPQLAEKCGVRDAGSGRN